MDTPAKFPFPFEPYPIQEQFMIELYNALKENKLGIFESPTGTGKSLSICCGALTWLKDFEAFEISEIENSVKQLKIDMDSVKTSEGDWLVEEHGKIVKTIEINKLLKKLEDMRKRNSKLTELKSGKIKQKLLSDKKDDYLKENKKQFIDDRSKDDGDSDLNGKTANVDELLLVEEAEEQLDDSSESEEENESSKHVQIYYGSRTHSQLNQFLTEIKRSPHSDIRAITLASRRHYCINPEVQKLKNLHLMDEKCMELRKSKQSRTTLKDDNGKSVKKQKKESATSCPYYNQRGIETLRDVALGEIHDIEELASVGKAAKGCPYYAARAATKDAQLVLLPHTSLLTNLTVPEDAVIILDEAHNLGNALASAFTVSVSISVLTNSKASLTAYISRYKEKFAPKTMLKLNQILFIINKLLALLQPSANSGSQIHNPFDFIVKAEIDHLNIPPLIKFCHDSKLPQKLHWFSLKMKNTPEAVTETTADKLKSFLSSMSKPNKKVVETVANDKQEVGERQKDGLNEATESSGSPLYTLLRFLEFISTSTEDGRVCIQRDSKSCLKYLLLDPTKRFSPITQAAKSIILAGGTMQPDWEFSRLLLSGGAKEDRLHKVSCDHVVDPENVKALIMHSGPAGKSLKITHATRNDTAVLDEIGRIVQNLCRIVPGGVICFLSSYSYEEVFYNHLQKSGLLTQISKVKTVYREPKDAKHVDKLLDSYNKVVKESVRCKDQAGAKTGALLLSVVGGKLSEGLNFSDELGRCVVVIGLPYGDKRSLEEQARWNYLDLHVGKGAGNANYQANCMKQVNQCIGRAVRHVNDWASMVLLDERYSQQNVINQLPTWIKKSLEVHEKFGPAFGSLVKFYKKHNIRKEN